MSLNANVFAALNPYVRDLLSFDGHQLGQLVSGAGLASAVGALVLGPLVDRLGRRQTLLWGTMVFLLASAGYLWAAGFWSLLTVRLATGFVSGLVLTSASSAVADLVGYENRGRAMGIVTAAILLAVPVGMPVAIALAECDEWFGVDAWRGVFVVQMLAAAVTLVVLWRALPAGEVRAETPTRSGRAPAQFRVLVLPMVAPALLSVALYSGAFFATIQFLPDWLDRSALLPKGDQALMWVVLGVVSAAGSAALGGLADKLGKRNFVLWSTGLVAIGFLALAQVHSIWPLVVVGIPVGVLSASRGAALLALVSDLVPSSDRGTLMGLRAAAVNLGTGTVPVAAGYLMDFGGFAAWLYAAALLVALAWLLVLVWLKGVR